MMKLQVIKERLDARSILYSEDGMGGRPTVIGYEKKFRWSWFATQLNTFIVASDFGADEVTVDSIESFLTESFAFASSHYSGWPRGLQSGLGVIGILLSEVVGEEARAYCTELKSGKKWAGFSIPVAIDSAAGRVYSFEQSPVWGAIYFPHFRGLIDGLCND